MAVSINWVSFLGVSLNYVKLRATNSWKLRDGQKPLRAAASFAGLLG